MVSRTATHVRQLAGCQRIGIGVLTVWVGASPVTLSRADHTRSDTRRHASHKECFASLIDQLRKSFKEREQIREKAEKIKGELEQFQKASIVGQMSNIFAHEVKQPLHALYCYAHALQRSIDNGKSDEELLKEGLRNLCTKGG